MEQLIEGARVEYRKDKVLFINGNAEKEVDRAIRLAEHEANWPPEELAYLSAWFDSLSGWRNSSFGVGPLSHLEIECWARLMRIEPMISPFEVDVLRRLDAEFRVALAEEDDENSSPTPIADSFNALAADNKNKKKNKGK